MGVGILNPFSWFTQQRSVSNRKHTPRRTELRSLDVEMEVYKV